MTFAHLVQSAKRLSVEPQLFTDEQILDTLLAAYASMFPSTAAFPRAMQERMLFDIAKRLDTRRR